MYRKMWFLFLITGVVLAGILAACGSPAAAPVDQQPAAAQPADDVEAVTAAVNQVWEQYASSLNAGDVDRYMALWADNAIQLPPDSLPLVGKETLRAGLESEVKAITYDMKIINEEVNVSGDQAVARGTYAATITPKDGSEPVSINGKYMTLLKRQPDGSGKSFEISTTLTSRRQRRLNPNQPTISKRLQQRSIRSGISISPVSMRAILIDTWPCGPMMASSYRQTPLL